jgi:8-oxo-dGTP pyrophosphatase MutT (NUDIX family)
MEHLDETTYEKRPRAGLIPYLWNQGVPNFLMMIASDSKFGGPRPMLSKGKIEDGESEIECALREAEEELGLLRENLTDKPFLVAEEQVVLRSGTYYLTVYAAPIRDRWDFGKWCDETEYTRWMTLEEFREEGRKDHIKFVEQLSSMLLGGNHAHADLSAGPTRPATPVDQS